MNENNRMDNNKGNKIIKKKIADK